MQRVMIVEDEPNQRMELAATIEQNYPGWYIQTASTFDQANALLSSSIQSGQTYTLFLLDIQLSPKTDDRGGFLLADEIRKHSEYYRTPLLFLTSVSDKNHFALSHYHCYNYIAKPYQNNEIVDQIQHMIMTGYLQETTLSLKDEFRIFHTITLDDILYAQSAAHTITLILKQSTLTTRDYTMNSLLEVLGGNFCRCHKKYIINLNYIKSYDRTTQCIMVDDHCLSVGRAYKELLERSLPDFS